MWKCSPSEQYVQLLKVGPSAQNLCVHLAGKWARLTSLLGSLLFRLRWLWSAQMEVCLPQWFSYIESHFTKRLLPTVTATISVFTWVHSYGSQSEFWFSSQAGQSQMYHRLLGQTLYVSVVPLMSHSTDLRLQRSSSQVPVFPTILVLNHNAQRNNLHLQKRDT